MPVISDDLYNLMLTAGFFADSSKFHLPLDYNADFSHMRCHHTSCVTVFIGLKSFLCKFIGISTWITLTLNLQNDSWQQQFQLESYVSIYYCTLQNISVNFRIFKFNVLKKFHTTAFANLLYFKKTYFFNKMVLLFWSQI